jgi:hypothetical protein
MTPSLKRCWRASRWPLLALAVAATAVLAHEVRRRRPPPRSVAELVDRLRRSGVCVWVVPVAQWRPPNLEEEGAFLCERDRSREELALLRRAAEYQADWAGVVLVKQWPHWEDAEFVLREWQGCSAWVGDLLLFGDPDMLRRIVGAAQR